MQGGKTGKLLLEEPGGQAIGHTQVIQALSRPLIQFEEQGRQVLSGRDNLFQQADGLEDARERTQFTQQREREVSDIFLSTSATPGSRLNTTSTRTGFLVCSHGF